jgi:VCBS repeat-containing protein
VLGNDGDAEGSQLMAIQAVDPAVGDLQLEANGAFKYTPPPNYHGIVTFDYQAFDGTFPSSATRVTIDVTSVNDEPVAEGDEYRTVEDVAKSVAAPGVLANDDDDDGDPLTAVLDRGPVVGQLDLRPNGSFVYTPEPNWEGSLSFTYHAFDGQSSSEQATVILKVTGRNDPPVAGNDSYSTKEDTELQVDKPGLLDNDRDADGDELTLVLDIPPARGELELEDDGSFVYTPEPDDYGQVSFVYHLTDGIANSNQATVSLEITPVNDVPEAQDDNYKTLVNSVRRVAAPGVLGNDRDADADRLTAVLDRGPAKGDLELEPDGSFVYTPEPGDEGVYSFKYHAHDGEEDSDEAAVTLTVASQNEAPESEEDAYTTAEDRKLVVRAPGVLDNDDDPDQDLLSARLQAAPSSGKLVLDADGSFVYTPEKDFNGVVTFTYRAYDGLEESEDTTVNLEVTPVNDPPEARADAYWTKDDRELTVSRRGVLGNDRDPDGDELTAELDAGIQVGELRFSEDGSFAYVPEQGNFGTFAFTYRASDGQVSSDPATVTIHVVEAIPIYLPLILR